MAGHFARISAQQVAHCVDRILSKGADVLYDHYLTERLPEHATSQNVSVLQLVVDPQTKFAQKSHPIRGDSQPCKITRDSIAMKSVQVRRIPLSTKHESKGSLTPSNKLPARKKFSSISNRLSNVSQPKEQRRPEVASAQLIRLAEPVLNEEAVDELYVEDGMRKRKHEQWVQSISQKEKENTQKQQLDERLRKLTHEFEEIERKHQRYTYDFEGRVLNCGPSIAPSINQVKQKQQRVKLGEESKPTEVAKSPKKARQQATNQKSTTTNSETFNSVAFNSIHGSKLTKALRGNSTPNSQADLGSDFVRNEIFNNNNKRQMSNINLIDLCEGGKLVELDTHVIIASDRNEPVTRNSFLEKIAKLRFRSFFQNSQQNVEVQPDFERENSPQHEQDDEKKGYSRANTTKLPSSMSGRTKRYTLREKDSIPNTGDRKPLTATESFRKKSESLRPKTSTREAWGRVVANEQMLELLFE